MLDRCSWGAGQTAPRTQKQAVVPYLCETYNTAGPGQRSLRTLSAKPKILFVCGSPNGTEPDLARLGDQYEIVPVRSPLRALARLTRDEFSGIFVSAEHLKEALTVGKLLQNERILQGMPDGVVLLDSDNTIIWGNGRLREWTGRDNVVGANFYAVLGSPEILGPDFCPFHTALATGRPSSSTLRSSDNRYFRVHAAPVFEADDPPQEPDRHDSRRDGRNACSSKSWPRSTRPASSWPI